MACSDLALVNGRVITFDPQCPHASCVVIRNGCVACCGGYEEIRPFLKGGLQVIDVAGAVVIPAFHDAHLHLLSYARQSSRVDCRELTSFGALHTALRTHAASLPDRAWVRAVGYDETRMDERRHPDRADLDAAVAGYPVRLQHRSLHLDVLNTRALRLTGLWDTDHAAIERDTETRQPTGRLFQAGELLRDRIPHGGFAELASDVRRASQQLLAWGVTSVQDATVTNGAEQWSLFVRLVEEGCLSQRVTVFAGARHWRKLTEGQAADGRVRPGPVKIMIEEAGVDLPELCAIAREATAAGRSVAIHATSEAEVAMALEVLRDCPRPTRVLHRIEHGSVIPDALLPELRALGVAVVGQPSLVHLRGDVYRDEYAEELHGWLHRARSLLAAGVPYAIGSDAPVTDPNPGLALYSARHRSTRGGATFGSDERLDLQDALRALTIGPAHVIGAAHELGHLSPGAVGDLVVLDPDALDAAAPEAACRPVRMTIMGGRVIWRGDS